MAAVDIDLSGIEEVARQYADTRNLVVKWGEERGLSLEETIMLVAGYANDRDWFEYKR